MPARSPDLSCRRPVERALVRPPPGEPDHACLRLARSASGAVPDPRSCRAGQRAGAAPRSRRRARTWGRRAHRQRAAPIGPRDQRARHGVRARRPHAALPRAGRQHRRDRRRPRGLGWGVRPRRGRRGGPRRHGDALPSGLDQQANRRDGGPRPRRAGAPRARRRRHRPAPLVAPAGQRVHGDREGHAAPAPRPHRGAHGRRVRGIRRRRARPDCPPGARRPAAGQQRPRAVRHRPGRPMVVLGGRLRGRAAPDDRRDGRTAAGPRAPARARAARHGAQHLRAAAARRARAPRGQRPRTGGHGGRGPLPHVSGVGRRRPLDRRRRTSGAGPSASRARTGVSRTPCSRPAPRARC